MITLRYPNSRSLATRYCCGRSGLHPAAVGAQQLLVFDVVQGTGPLWDDMVSLQGAVRELATAPVEPSLLLG